MPRVVSITGGARGIGLATAQALAERGYHVAIGDLDGDEAEAAASSLPGTAADHTAHSETGRPSAAFTTSVGRTSRALRRARRPRRLLSRRRRRMFL
ncbi:MAG: SDR family NAD(P)-dependent oxidoreductase, partial [Gemmatimonadales bacterium]